MVLFLNVNVGQEVEVYYQGGIEKGVVKYKGGLSNTPGDWVGVHLDRQVGQNSGIYKGRQYFTCPQKHGIFVHPARVRFCALRRTYFNHYRSVSPSYVEETLFASHNPKERSNTVASEYTNLAKSGFNDLSASWSAGQGSSSYSTAKSKTFNLGHPVGRTYTPKKHQRSKSALEIRYGRVSPMTKFYESPDTPFISNATVPKIYNPANPEKMRPQSSGFVRNPRPLDWSIY